MMSEDTNIEDEEIYDDTFKVITANRLSDGHVVYLSLEKGERSWTTRVGGATVLSGPEISEALKNAEADVTANIVVGPYATEITGKNQPLGAKEEIRASGGPSVRFGEARVTPKDPDYSI